jgi:hypothetical protein
MMAATAASGDFAVLRALDSRRPRSVAARTAGGNALSWRGARLRKSWPKAYATSATAPASGTRPFSSRARSRVRWAYFDRRVA